MTHTYRFANEMHSIVLRDNTPIFWHPSSNTPADYRDAQRWLVDGNPAPSEFVDSEELRNILARAGVKTE